MTIGDPGLNGYTDLIFSKATITATDVVDLKNESLKNDIVTLETGEKQNSIFDSASYTVVSQYNPNGGFSWYPRFNNLNSYLEMAFGTTGPYTPSKTLVAGKLQVTRSGPITELYTPCYVDEFNITGEEGQPLLFETTLMIGSGSKITTGVVTPSYTNVEAGMPLMFDMMALSGDIGIAEKIFSYKLTTKRNLKGEYANSTNRNMFSVGKYEAQLDIELAMNVTTLALLDTYFDTTDRRKPVMDITATWSDGTNSMAITFTGHVTSPRPNITSTEAQRFTLSFKGVLSGTDAVPVYPVKIVVS
jgi:hypothetical protein